MCKKNKYPPMVHQWIYNGLNKKVQESSKYRMDTKQGQIYIIHRIRSNDKYLVKNYEDFDS